MLCSITYYFLYTSQTVNINCKRKQDICQQNDLHCSQKSFMLVIYLQGETRKWSRKKICNKTWRLVPKVIDPKLISHVSSIQVWEGKGEKAGNGMGEVRHSHISFGNMTAGIFSVSFYPAGVQKTPRCGIFQASTLGKGKPNLSL